MTPQSESAPPRDAAACDVVDAAAALFISVVVPVRNEAQYIEHTLNQLVAQHYDPQRFEILVVDGESTDGTPELVAAFVRRHGNVRLFSNPLRLSSAARNIGVRHARGDVVLVVDGHCSIDDNRHLDRVAAAFETSGADCIGRPQPLDAADAVRQAIAAARSSPLGHHPDSYIYSSREGFVPAKSVAVAYRREIFNAVGLFDESFDACEDVEFNHRVDRAALRCYFTPQIAVRYFPRDSLAGLFRQLVRYGRGRVRLLRKHPDTFSLRAMVPLCFVLGVVIGLPLSFLAAWVAPLYVGALLLYAAAVLLVSLGMAARRHKVSLLLRLPLVFAVIHFGSGAGMLWELCARAKTRSRQGKE